MWEDEEPEEDPGVVYVIVDKGDSSALLFYGGPAITGDPRELDLPISVETLFDIANDPRVDVTTSAEAVDAAGAGLSFWQNAKREPQWVGRPRQEIGDGTAKQPAWTHSTAADECTSALAGWGSQGRGPGVWIQRCTGSCISMG